MKKGLAASGRKGDRNKKREHTLDGGEEMAMVVESGKPGADNRKRASGSKEEEYRGASGTNKCTVCTGQRGNKGARHPEPVFLSFIASVSRLSF